MRSHGEPLFLEWLAAAIQKKHNQPSFFVTKNNPPFRFLALALRYFNHGHLQAIIPQKAQRLPQANSACGKSCVTKYEPEKRHEEIGIFPREHQSHQRAASGLLAQERSILLPIWFSPIQERIKADHADAGPATKTGIFLQKPAAADGVVGILNIL
jgi:hypothetical protein